MLTLGIETSCDDTSAAVIKDDNIVLSNIVSSQDLVHKPFGGIVPELASRRHLESITLVVDQALSTACTSLADINLISVTRGPGLIGSLLVGFSYAKALSYTLNKPYIGVDHMMGHIVSVFLENETPEFPYIALIVSGGTTAIYRVDGFMECKLLGRTRDDAAGEAFDKVARLLNLGYPGGPIISRHARKGNPNGLVFPRAWLDEDSYDFSFSGLKTAVMNHCNNHRQKYGVLDLDTVCASFQEAVIDVLTEKAISAARHQGMDRIVVGGGVSANTRLREHMTLRCAQEEMEIYLSAPENCTDNGAMIAFAGLKGYQSGLVGSLDDDVYSRSHLGQ